METTLESRTFKVMIIEDDEFIRLFLRDTLLIHSKDKKVTLAMATNIEEADRELEAETPDLIFLDLGLPMKAGEKANPNAGFVFLQKIRADKMYKNVPILVFSGYSDQELKDRAMGIGATNYMVKGEFLPKDIIEAVEKARSSSPFLPV